MSLDVATLTKLLDRLSRDYRLDLRSCDARLKSKIDRLPIPEGYRFLFSSCWPQTPDLSFINYYHIHSSSQLISSENTDEFLPHQLFAIGSSTTGDMLVLDFAMEPAKVLVVSHDQWERGNDPRSNAAVVTNSLEEFLKRAIHEMPVPSDHYEALDARKL